MRLIDADELFVNLDGMMAVSPTGYIHGDTVADMIGDAPTVDAIPISFIEGVIELSQKVGADHHVESLEILLRDWAERKEE